MSGTFYGSGYVELGSARLIGTVGVVGFPNSSSYLFRFVSTAPFTSVEIIAESWNCGTVAV